MRGCTKHVVRLYRRLGDDGSGAFGRVRRPRHLSVPSSRPRQRLGSTRRRWPVSARLGCGAAHAGRWRHAPPATGARADGPSQAQGSGAEALEVSWRSLTPARKAYRAPLCGASRCWPVRLQAQPLPSLRGGQTSPYQKPPGVAAYERPHGPAAGPGWSRLSPGHGCAPGE
jgi:hypothetical protein